MFDEIFGAQIMGGLKYPFGNILYSSSNCSFCKTGVGMLKCPFCLTYSDFASFLVLCKTAQLLQGSQFNASNDTLHVKN